MQKPQVVADFLVPTDEHTPEAIHPTMRAFDHPAPGFEPRLLLECLGFVPTSTDVCREAKLLQEVPHLVVVVALIQTQPLRPLRGRVGPLYGDACNGGVHQLEIIPIRTVHGQPDGDAAAVGEQAALRTDLAAVGRILADLFPPQAGLWSSRHPWLATPNRCPA